MQSVAKQWMQKPAVWTQSTKEFWRETRSEMKKVSWPSREEVVSTTSVVIGATIFAGVYLWLCDIVFFRMIDWLFRTFGAA